MGCKKFCIFSFFFLYVYTIIYHIVNIKYLFSITSIHCDFNEQCSMLMLNIILCCAFCILKCNNGKQYSVLFKSSYLTFCFSPLLWNMRKVAINTAIYSFFKTVGQVGNTVLCLKIISQKYHSFLWYYFTFFGNTYLHQSFTKYVPSYSTHILKKLTWQM